MTTFCNTRHGRLRRIRGGAYLLELPCGETERVSAAQFDGKVSINHGVVCPHDCGFHETVDFRAVVEAAGGWRTH